MNRKIANYVDYLCLPIPKTGLNGEDDDDDDD